jgi:hypothetical protein
MINLEQPKQTKNGYAFVIRDGSASPYTVELSQSDVDKKGGADNIQSAIQSKLNDIDNSDHKADVFIAIVKNVKSDTSNNKETTVVDSNGQIKKSEAVLDQPNIESDNVSATILGEDSIQDLSSIRELKSVSDPANVIGKDFTQETVLAGPSVNPYKNINPNKNVTDEVREIIGGSDLSVFMVMEVPLVADLDLPDEAQRKEILTIELENVLSLGYSTVRERYPVRVLGESNPRSYTRGSRTIAGHLAFNVFTKDAIQYIRGRVAQELQTIEDNIYDQKMTEDQKTQVTQEMMAYNTAKNTLRDKVQLLDDLPLFHILCMGANENGVFSKFLIKNVSIVDENQYQGTQQPNIINKVSWVAQDLVPMNEVEKWNQKTVVISSVNSIESSYSRGNYQSKINYNYEVTGSNLLDDTKSSIGGN